MNTSATTWLTQPAELDVANSAGLTPLDLATSNMLGHEHHLVRFRDDRTFP